MLVRTSFYTCVFKPRKLRKIKSFSKNEFRPAHKGSMLKTFLSLPQNFSSQQPPSFPTVNLNSLLNRVMAGSSEKHWKQTAIVNIIQSTFVDHKNGQFFQKRVLVQIAFGYRGYI